jgi:hypothetical protein
MDTRFRTSDAAGVELPWQTTDDLLDALEAGRLEAEDYVFDAVRQAWQPIRNHSEIVTAWDQRMSYRPPEQRRLISNARRPHEGFPALSSEGTTPVSSPAISRIEAQRRAAASTSPDEIPAVRRAVAAGEVAFLLAVVGVLAAGLVMLARAFVAMVSPSAP